MRKFNTEGPVVAADHYSIPPLERVNLGEVLGLVRDKRYFVLHAPRQTGKTSTLLVLRDLLNSGIESRIAPTRRLHASRGARAARPAHRGDRTGVHPGGARYGVDADPGPAMAGERSVPQSLLRQRGGARLIPRDHRHRHLRRPGASCSEPACPPRPAPRQAPGRPRATRRRAVVERRQRARLLGP